MAGINELVRRLERFGSGQVKERIAQRVAGVLQEQTLACFQSQRDPYGSGWQKRLDPKGSWAILNKTGAGIDSIRATPTATSARVAILGRMKWHQTGTARMVSRAFFPDEARGLGLWSDPVNKAARDAVSELMKG